MFAVLRIVLPLVWRVNGLYAAKTIEGADPSFKNSLVNYLDLRPHRGELPKSFLAAIEAKAVNDLTQVEVDAVVNQHQLIHVWYVLAAVVLLCCVYAALDAQEYLRLGAAGVPGRRGPANQHPAAQHQARR